MKTVIWNLNEGGKDGQARRDEKYAAGMAYVEKLKKNFTVSEVNEFKDKIVIEIDENS